IISAFNSFGAVKNPDAEAIINSFLDSHGFSLPHRVEWSDFRNGYIVQPLSVDGTPLTYEHFSSPLLVVTLDQQGHVASLMAGLVDVQGEPVARYGIISAEEALQHVLEPGLVGGMIDGMNAVGGPVQQWTRKIPLDQTRTFYGTVFTTQGVQAGQPPFVQLDGYPVSGQIAGLDQLPPHTQVQAVGRLVLESGIERLHVDSWMRAPVLEDGLGGKLERDGDQVVFLTEQNDRLILPDPPADLPLPYENAFVLGTREGDTFQWKLIDNRMALQGGGGGGGGGAGFYKLNLTGTPVPFPSPTAMPGPGAAGAGEYTVQAGDTLGAIAAANNTDVGALMQANGLTDPNTLSVGQKLTIPGAAAPQKVEGLRGTLNITISKQPDGSQYVTYGFLTNGGSQPGQSMLLQGDNLDELQRYNSRPVDVWGTLHNPGSGGTIPTISVDRFEIPFPELKVQILQGTQKQTDIAGQPAVLFTASDGTTYIMLFADGSTGGPMIGKEGDRVQVECVIVPDETVGGYPGLRFFGGMLAIDPKTGQHVNMPLTADQPHIVDMPSIGKPGELPTATIENIELVHFASDPRYRAKDSGGQQIYFQPVWRFYGHYSTGDEFEILIQALKQEYLLPEIEPAMQPG
ncbi:MAG: LysM peptidoglycan-binding domain-containing protein, partial [Anaerolineae bacterium]